MGNREIHLLIPRRRFVHSRKGVYPARHELAPDFMPGSQSYAHIEIHDLGNAREYLNVEPIRLSRIIEAYDRVASGEIDFLPAAVYSQERGGSPLQHLVPCRRHSGSAVGVDHRRCSGDCAPDFYAFIVVLKRQVRRATFDLQDRRRGGVVDRAPLHERSLEIGRLPGPAREQH
jgi:hypothetical protein